jgi:cysteinyl-tRNA synthetase
MQAKLQLYNTLSRTTEPFEAINEAEKKVGLYTCGPTVYNFAHIGNLRTYIFEDILKRTLIAHGYTITHVMNITDVGHLSGEDDTGEDKMEKGAKREGKTAWEIAEFYTHSFKKNLADLNILEPDIWCKATDHIAEQIAQVQTLIDKDYTYETSDGIYFDTTKFPQYGEMALLHKQELQAGVRVDLGEKKNAHDFALWKFSSPNEKRQMEWKAFGRMGFPGWHIECSAMSMRYLGKHFDIHCGGIDHIPVHHTNEIAQAECAGANHPWVNFWMHGEFLLIDAGKMSKSDENFITLDTLIKKGYSPLAYRYFLLQAHYRKQLNFSWEALEAAEKGLNKLYEFFSTRLPLDLLDDKENESYLKIIEEVKKDNNTLDYSTAKRKLEILIEAISNDLNTPECLGLLNKYINEDFGSSISPSAWAMVVHEIDKILGLNLREGAYKIYNQKKNTIIPDEVKKLLDERETARTEKNWGESDRLRDEIAHLGFEVKDTADGQEVFPHTKD